MTESEVIDSVTVFSFMDWPLAEFAFHAKPQGYRGEQIRPGCQCGSQDVP